MANLFGRKPSTKLTNVDPETGTRTFDVEYLPDFSSLLQNVEDSYNIAKNLQHSSEIKSSDEFNDIYEYILMAKNSLRQYLRTYYRNEYNNLKETMKKSELRQIIREEIASMSAGVGEQYASKDILDEDISDTLNKIKQAYYGITDNIGDLIDKLNELETYGYKHSKDIEGKSFDIKREVEIWMKVALLIQSSRIGIYL